MQVERKQQPENNLEKSLSSGRRNRNRVVSETSKVHEFKTNDSIKKG
jgi:hypothetical protein